MIYDLNEVTTTSLIKEAITTNSVETSADKNEENTIKIVNSNENFISENLVKSNEESINENSNFIVISSSKSKDKIINNLQDIINDKEPDNKYLTFYWSYPIRKSLNYK